MLFDSWQGLGRVLLLGVLAYPTLVLLLRVSGNRTLSKLNAFDMVITVALGSTLATVLVNRGVAFVEGITAFALLIGLQFAATWWSVRSPAFRRLVKSEPVLLVHRGEPLRGSMRRARVLESEIASALRAEGVADLQSVEAVVLESDGSLSVVQGRGRALRDVEPKSTRDRGDWEAKVS